MPKAIDMSVSDVDAAIEFHRDRVGCVVDHDAIVDADQLAHLTPHGSGYSTGMGEGPFPTCPAP